jgi:hypothetical protein
MSRCCLTRSGARGNKSNGDLLTVAVAAETATGPAAERIAEAKATLELARPAVERPSS